MKRQELRLSLSPQKIVTHLSEEPGIYIFRQGDNVLYIGKARNLRNRVRSYLHSSHLNIKSRRFMEKADNLQVTITRNNTEALLLEQNLIKEHHPPYNISLRDDKSYPFIFISDHSDYPLVTSHRGAQKRKGRYYGPYPHASTMHRSIDLLQKVFKIRNCTDSFFSNRSRPCLQYQIGRCSAPCVGAISPADYQRNIDYVHLFLHGKSTSIIQKIGRAMQQAANKLEYERAAELRNQMSALRQLQENQYANRAVGNLDCLAILSHGNIACVYILYVRQGKVLGSRYYFFQTPAFDTEENLLADFIAQYYTKPQLDLPDEILVPFDWKDSALIREAMKKMLAHTIKFSSKPRGDKNKWLAMAVTNCQATLINALNTQQNIQQEFNLLQKIIGRSHSIRRIECFDISHSSGEATQAACVVFTAEGAQKQNYRRYNITSKGDDYAAMHQAIKRRYGAPKISHIMPELILIDGGRGQLNIVVKSLENLHIRGIYVMAIAKGEKRKFGYETFYLSEQLLNGSKAIKTMEYSRQSHRTALNLLLRIRDEAHRFALHGHKRKRTKTRLSSQLDQINGLGEIRKRNLLKHFGSLQKIRNAGIDDITQVSGFGKQLARSIFHQLRK